MTFNEMYETLIEYNVATADEIDLVCSIGGFNEIVLTNILYARTAYNDFQTFLEEEAQYR